MRNKSLFSALTILILVTGCVPTQKLVYLQKDNEDEVVNYDTSTAKYESKRQSYTLQAGDIISLRVASITDDDYHFIKKYEENLGLIRKLSQYNQSKEESQGNSGNMFSRSGDGGLPAILLDQQNSGFVLDPNGNLELPQIGLIELSGMTIPMAEMKVKELLKGYYETPMVRIQLLNYHFTILGEVNKEGRYTSFDPEITIFDVIPMAGNLTEFADRSQIKIVRTENGERKVIYLNTLDEKTLGADNLYIKRGDLIIVPALKARTASMYTLPNVSRTLGIVGTALSVLALIITLNN